MPIVHFAVPGRPFAWRRAQQFASVLAGKAVVRKFTDKDMAANQKKVATLACEAWGRSPPHFGPVKVLVMARFAIPSSWPLWLRMAAMEGEVFHDSKPDADNLLKNIQDALQFVAFVDDGQLADCRVIAKFGPNEGTDVYIDQLPGPITPNQREREKRWRTGAYDAAIAKSPAGRGRSPRILDASAQRTLL